MSREIKFRGLPFNDIDFDEVWKDIKGHEGLYQISNMGRVKSLSREVWNGKVFYMIDERILLASPDNKGYLHVGISNNGVHKTKKIHRLVAETFVSKVKNKLHINHIDCNKQNNCVSNLEWVTPKENTNHAIENGMIDYNIWKFAEEIIDEYINNKMTIEYISHKYHVGRKGITDLLKKNNIEIDQGIGRICTKDKLIKLLNANLSLDEISKITGLKKNTVSINQSNYRKSGEVSNEYKGNWNWKNCN